MRRTLEALLVDARLGLRGLLRRPALVLLAALTLALGLASHMTAFSLLSSLLLRPHPFPDLERLVLLREHREGTAPELQRLTPSDFLDVEHEVVSFEAVSAYRYSELNLSGDGVPESVRTFHVSGSLFSTVGIEAAHGRVFPPGEGRHGDERVAVVAFGLFERRFGADPSIVGSEIFLNGAAYTVVGVTPKHVNFPRSVDVFVPLELSVEESVDRSNPALYALARLAPGVSFDQARAELDGFGERLKRRYPDTHRERIFRLLPLREEQYEYTFPLFSTLQVASFLVLLLAAANVGNLVLVWRVARSREAAVRTALGAPRSRLLRQSFLECLFLAVAALLVGAFLGFWTVELVRNAMPQGIAMHVYGWRDIRMDAASVFAGATVALVLAVALSGVGIAGSRARHVLSSLQAGRASAGNERSRLRTFLTGAQIALALVVLSGAVWLLRGFEAQMSIFSRLEPSGILTGRVTLPRERYPDSRDWAQFFERLLARVSELPSAESVALVTNLPASNVPNEEVFFSIENREPPTEGDTPRADIQRVGGAFFELFRARVLSGRALDERDDADSLPAVVVSETWARDHFAGEDPLGRRVRIGAREAEGEWRTIVGVVSDTKQNWFDPVPRPTLYLSHLQSPRSRIRIAIRSNAASGGGYELVEPLRQKLASIDPHQALASTTTLEDEIADSLAPLRIIGILLLCFAGIALVLAATGVYGVVSSNVVERTREFGLRMALGARSAEVLRQVLRETLRLATVALALGVPATLGLNLVLAGRFYGLVAVSPLTLVTGGALLLAVAAAAAYLPARSATRLDPVRALRWE